MLDRVLCRPKITEIFIAFSQLPHNWDLQRIKEEVALVYENTVVKGLNKRPKQPSDIFDKYEGLSTTGFKIRIETDELGNIMNTYPIT